MICRSCHACSQCGLALCESIDDRFLGSLAPSSAVSSLGMRQERSSLGSVFQPLALPHGNGGQVPVDHVAYSDLHGGCFFPWPYRAVDAFVIARASSTWSSTAGQASGKAGTARALGPCRPFGLSVFSASLRVVALRDSGRREGSEQPDYSSQGRALSPTRVNVLFVGLLFPLFVFALPILRLSPFFPSPHLSSICAFCSRPVPHA